MGWCGWRRVWRLCIITALCMIASAAIGDSACVILNTQNDACCTELIRSIELTGASVKHVFAPQLLICDAGLSSRQAISTLPQVRAVITGQSSPGEFSDLQPACALGLKVWNSMCAPHVTLASATEDNSMPGIDTSLLSNQVTTEQADTQSVNYTPGYNQTSSFMLGSIAVGIILPESKNGTENWSQDRITSVLTKIVQGMNWWIGRSGGRARLTVYYDAPEQNLGATCDYEPVSLDCISSDAWIKNTLGSLGYTGTYDNGTSLTLKYINDIRTKYKTDWCFCVYVADSYNDVDGCFADGTYSFAYRQGPLVVMTYDCGPWGHSRMDQVFRHEVGHIFGAADEYCAGYSCCDFGSYGYLNVQNTNCAYGNPESKPCVMRDNSDNLCESTMGQVGWRDSDGDGIYDPIDTTPACTASCAEGSSTLSSTLHISGTANDIPFATPTFTPVTINKITDVEFNIDAGAWSAAAATDGKFDSSQESFNFQIACVQPGGHVINIRATNTAGNFSPLCTLQVTVLPGEASPVVVIDDGLYTNDTTMLHAKWSATDPEIQVSEYKYAVGTTPVDTGSGYVKGWTSAGTCNDTNITLSMQDGCTYYIYVQAANSSGVWSDAAASDGITAEPSKPIGSVKSSADGLSVSLSYKLVTASLSDCFFVEDDNRSCGLKVSPHAGVAAGDRVNVTGFMRTTDAQERYIQPTSVDTVCHGESLPEPMGVNLATAMYSKLCYGLLVRLWGYPEEAADGLWKLKSGVGAIGTNQYVYIRPAASTSLIPSSFTVLDGVLAPEQTDAGKIIVLNVVD